MHVDRHFLINGFLTNQLDLNLIDDFLVKLVLYDAIFRARQVAGSPNKLRNKLHVTC